MLEELTKSFKAILYDRVVSPLSGAFILSWSVINWKIFVLLFMGDETASARIANIESLSYMALSWESFFHLLAIPLISALFFIFAYPYPSKWAYSFAKDRSEELIKIKQEKEKKRLLTREESDEITVQMERTKHEGAIIIKEKNAAIEALNEKLKSYEAAIDSAPNTDSALDANDSERLNEKNPEGTEGKGANFYQRDIDIEYRDLKSKNFFVGFEKVINDVYQNRGVNLNPSEIQKYYIANIIWERGTGKYVFTEKGLRMAHLFQSGR